MQEVSPCHDFIFRQRSLLSDRLISGNKDTCYQFWPPLDSGGHQSSTLLAVCEGNPLGTSGFPSHKASNAERISMPWLYHQTKIIIVWPTNFWERWHLLPGSVPITFSWTSKLHVAGPLWGESLGTSGSPHKWSAQPLGSPHKWPPMQKGFRCDDTIMRNIIVVWPASFWEHWQLLPSLGPITVQLITWLIVRPSSVPNYI